MFIFLLNTFPSLDAEHNLAKRKRAIILSNFGIGSKYYIGEINIFGLKDVS
jgi:hypothetical protein